MFRGKIKRPKGSISAVVIKADGTRIPVGIIAGEGRDDPQNLKLGQQARKKIDQLLAKELKKEADHGC